MIRLTHPKLPDAEYEAISEEQADALAASGWKRRRTEKKAPTKTTAPRKRTAAKATATPKAAAATNEEK